MWYNINHSYGDIGIHTYLKGVFIMDMRKLTLSSPSIYPSVYFIIYFNGPTDIRYSSFNLNMAKFKIRK